MRAVVGVIFTPPGPMIRVTSKSQLPVMVNDADEPKWVKGLLVGFENTGGAGGVLSTPGVLPPSMSSVGCPPQPIASAIAIAVTARMTVEATWIKVSRYPRFLMRYIGRIVKNPLGL